MTSRACGEEAEAGQIAIAGVIALRGGGSGFGRDAGQRASRPLEIPRGAGDETRTLHLVLLRECEGLACGELAQLRVLHPFVVPLFEHSAFRVRAVRRQA